ncbi:hypothetical protein KL905_004173 [Ogataea polymorpha]|nr:hypothetical protein KL937_003727 [Ogataea polymorpha]KAG7907303.1 hypothetical protein KL906_003990 [Ogataea polymorpha]KAG7915206.1 hypothetical protein KL927_004195 [Ogataea polymorpha]KAG7918094.1 hypothetical protein KL905_004173 [Ogataea polymorpha]KAG7932412.1 hypothetical protein KL934_003855 [Ogataea polymorpha]
MIDQFLIFRPTGQVEFNYQPGKNLSNVVNAFIDDILVSERNLKTFQQAEKDDAQEVQDEEGVTVGSYHIDKYSVEYLSVNQQHTKLVFVMIHVSVLTLKSPFEFLRKIKTLYLNSDHDKFEQFFRLTLETLEQKKEEIKDAPQSELKEDKKKLKGTKKSRKWNPDGTFYEENDETSDLDFSTDSSVPNNGSANLNQLVGDKAHFGSKTKTGEFLVSDLSQEMDKILKKDYEGGYQEGQISIIHSSNQEKRGSRRGQLSHLGNRKRTCWLHYSKLHLCAGHRQEEPGEAADQAAHTE